MFSKVVDVAKSLKSYMLLEYRIPTYEERANVYKQQALMGSFRMGATIDKEHGVDSIRDIVETTSITLPPRNQIEFVQDTQGNYFIKISDGTYNPIDLYPSKELLRTSKNYKKLSRNVWKRYLREPIELLRLGPIGYKFDLILFSINDLGFFMCLQFEGLRREVVRLSESVESLSESLESLVTAIKPLDKLLEDATRQLPD